MRQDRLLSLMGQMIEKLEKGEWDKALHAEIEIERAKQPDFSKLSGADIMQAHIPVMGKRLGELTGTEVREMAEIERERASKTARIAEILEGWASAKRP